MSHQSLSLMNRLNQTESAVSNFWMLYFQRVYFQIICAQFNQIRLLRVRNWLRLVIAALAALFMQTVFVYLCFVELNRKQVQGLVQKVSNSIPTYNSLVTWIINVIIHIIRWKQAQIRVCLYIFIVWVWEGKLQAIRCFSRTWKPSSLLSASVQ